MAFEVVFFFSAESISPRMQGVKITSTASNVFEMTRNMAVLEGPQTANAAGNVDQPGSSSAIPAIRQGITISATLPEQAKMPLAVVEVSFGPDLHLMETRITLSPRMHFRRGCYLLHLMKSWS